MDAGRFYCGCQRPNCRHRLCRLAAGHPGYRARLRAGLRPATGRRWRDCAHLGAVTDRRDQDGKGTLCQSRWEYVCEVKGRCRPDHDCAACDRFDPE